VNACNSVTAKCMLSKDKNNNKTLQELVAIEATNSTYLGAFGCGLSNVTVDEATVEKQNKNAWSICDASIYRVDAAAEEINERFE